MSGKMPNRGGVPSGSSSVPSRNWSGPTPDPAKKRIVSTPSTATIPTVVSTVTAAQKVRKARTATSRAPRNRDGPAQCVAGESSASGVGADMARGSRRGRVEGERSSPPGWPSQPAGLAAGGVARAFLLAETSWAVGGT